MNGWGVSRILRLLLLPAFLALVSCSDEHLSIFFDIPPPTPEELAAEAKEKAEAEARAKREARIAAGQSAEEEKEAERPPIESVKTWEEAEKMLPKDDLDEVDWVKAIKEGVIKPRAAVKGPGKPENALFKWDFYFPGPDPSMDAYFPHSIHTEFVDCESCHIKIFPYRELELTMDQLTEGQYCGVCHNSETAFGLDNCARCHLSME